MARRRQRETPEAQARRVAVRAWRRRRAITGLNVLAAVGLMAVVTFLVNAVAERFPQQLQLAARSRHILSEKTIALLRGLDSEITVTALFDAESAYYDDVSSLLREYAYAAEAIPSLKFNLEIVDPQRDIARTRELARLYDIESGNQVIFACGEKRKVIDIGSLAQYELEMKESRVERRMVGFLGEQAFSSAILNVTEKTTPVVYFLSGHGERDVEDFEQGGYSALGRVISRENIDIRRLVPGEHNRIPEDCRALVVAGPDRQIADAMIAQIDDYLKSRHGRVLLMIDPGTQTGLEGMLEHWGITAGPGVVVGRTFSGRDLIVNTYGEHPITQGFKNVTTMFYMPMALGPLEPSGNPTALDKGTGSNEDRVRVSTLAGTGPEGWIETNLSQEPPIFDEAVDHRGPVAVAMAVERGAVGINAELQPTRMVVIGDSFFLSNRVIDSGVGGSVSFLLSALNWLVERDSLLTVAPRVPSLLQPELTKRQWRHLFGWLVFGIPGSLLLIGGVVALFRRR
ncbi:MAG TPA: hypothetical protein DCS43_08425 [Verrucomicrobia bacterium]|nr:hypothetical protein [Verrucomicrobiota bacterium]